MIDKIESLLTPAVMQDRLIFASLYILSYEILKDCIIGRTRSMFSDGFNKEGETIGSKYETDVLALDKKNNPLTASIAWLIKNDVIDHNDYASFARITDARNELAHRLPSFIIDMRENFVVKGIKIDFSDMLEHMLNLIIKIERWWIINVEVPTNPDFDGKEIDEEKVTPGSLLMIQLIIEVSSGRDSLLNQYRESQTATKS